MTTTVVLDIGYGYTKLAALLESGEEIGPISCPSAFAQAGRIKTEQAKAGRPRIRINGHACYWGEHVRYARDPVFSRERKRPLDMILILFMGLISETPIAGNVRIKTGLPVEWLEDADHVRTALIGYHEGIREDTGAEIAVNVLSVDVYPQPQCAFFQHAARDPSLWKDWIVSLVVDVGTGTTNVSFIDGGNWIDERAQSIPLGMGHVLEQALQAQESQQGGRDLLLTARAKLWARDEEIMAYAQGPIAQLAGRVNAVIADVVGDALVTTTILAGGGAHFQKDLLNLPGIVCVSEHPEMDNINGLLSIARFERK